VRGVDEVSLALVADARTYRSHAVTFAATDCAQQTRNGIRILPDQVALSWPAQNLLPPIGIQQPARALDKALQAIAASYGRRIGDFVAMQLEHPSAEARSNRDVALVILND
jgi:hypothetical protein